MLTSLTVVDALYRMGEEALFAATLLLAEASTCVSVWLHFDPYDGCHAESSGIVDAGSGTPMLEGTVQQRPNPAKIRHSE